MIESNRNLDVLIAELVMKIDVKSIVSEPGWEGLNTLYSKVRIPEYTSSIDAAFSVIEKMRASEYELALYSPIQRGIRETDNWTCEFTHGITHAWWSVEAETVELAICLCALECLEIEV